MVADLDSPLNVLILAVDKGVQQSALRSVLPISLAGSVSVCVAQNGWSGSGDKEFSIQSKQCILQPKKIRG